MGGNSGWATDADSGERLFKWQCAFCSKSQDLAVAEHRIQQLEAAHTGDPSIVAGIVMRLTIERKVMEARAREAEFRLAELERSLLDASGDPCGMSARPTDADPEASSMEGGE